MFNALQKETKIVDVRLFNDKRNLVDIEAYIEFAKKQKRRELKYRIIDLIIEESFLEFLGQDSDIWGKIAFFT